jgi:hypothetical protein
MAYLKDIFMSQEMIFIAFVSLSICLFGRVIYMASWLCISSIVNRAFNRMIFDANGALKITPWTINSILQAATVIFASSMVYGLESLPGFVLLSKMALVVYMFLFVPIKLLSNSKISIAAELERVVKFMAIIFSMRFISGLLM